MISSCLVPFITHAFAIIGSIYLFLSPFFARPWKFAPWVKVAFWILGPIGTTWGVLGFIKLFFRIYLSSQTYYLIGNAKTILGGVAIGIFGLFFLSGEFLKYRIK
jgi:hypothetical protein